MTPDLQYLNDFAARYTTAWCSQDPSQVAEFFAATGSLTINGGAPAVGSEAIAADAAGFMQAFPDLFLIQDRLAITDRDTVEYHWTLIGTYAANGRKVRISGYEEWTFDADGRIARSLGNFDAADYLRQIEAV